MTLFPRHHDRSLGELPFTCAPAEKPAKSFEDTKAGNAVLWVALGLAALVIGARFACVAFTGKAW